MKNKKLDKELKRELRQCRKIKKRCARKYPDWRDDEFNMGANKFIWGVAHNGAPPSFLTLNDIMIYYNRDYKLYFMDIDSQLLARDAKDRLAELKSEFENFASNFHQEEVIFPRERYCLCSASIMELWIHFTYWYMTHIQGLSN